MILLHNVNVVDGSRTGSLFTTVATPGPVTNPRPRFIYDYVTPIPKYFDLKY